MRIRIAIITAAAAAALAAPARAADPAPRDWLRAPAISADGRTIAFSFAGDIYVVPAEGGEARLVAGGPSYEARPRFSPDGARLAFTSDRTGRGDVYVVELATGALERLTFHEAPDLVECWSPDGHHIFFASGRAGILGTLDVYRVPARGGTPVPVLADPHEHESSASISPDGTTLAFTNGDTLRQWWRAGPRTDDGTEIWLAPATPSPGPARRVTRFPGKDSWPLFAPDGGALYFVSDEPSGAAAENIWTCALDGTGRRPLTAFRDGRVLFPQVAAREGTIVFERDFSIWRLDPRTGQAAPVPIRVAPVEARAPIDRRTYRGGDVEEFEVSPDGKKIAFIVHGEIFAAPTAGPDGSPEVGDAFRVTRTAARERGLAWTPDSARLLYSSDRDGAPNLFLYDFRTGEERRATRGAKADLFPAVSPDGKLAAYVSGTDEIRLLDLETLRSRPLQRITASDVEPADERPAWSPDGRWLAFLDIDERIHKNLYVAPVDATATALVESGAAPARVQATYLANLGGAYPSWLPDGRSIVLVTGHHRRDGRVVRVDLVPRAPEMPEARFDGLFAAGNGPASPAPPPETRVDPGGLRDRITRLVPFAKNVWNAAVSRDGKTLVYVQGGAGRDDIYAAPLGGDRAIRLTDLPTGSDNLRMDPDGRTLWFRSDGRIRSVPLGGGPIRTLGFAATLEVDFHAEKRQVFNEAWRVIRDHFFDPRHRGISWDDARRRHEPVAAGARNAVDLHDAISLMLGELNASHLGSYAPAPPLEAGSGEVGLLFDEAEQARSGKLVVRALVPHGPAHLAGGVAPGDELIRVEGRDALAPASLEELLLGTAGKRVRLGFLGKDGAGKTVDVQAIPPWELRRLLYRAWVREQEAVVARASGGRLGYVHILDMSECSLEQFELDLDGQGHGREGVVLDVRWNRGGWVAPFVIEALERRAFLEGVLRDRARTSAWDLAGKRVLDLPTVLVQNHASLSNAEMFAEAYRRLGLGKIVGEPSCGWVVWTSDWWLLDGATFRIPRFGIRSEAGEDLDEVSRRPDLLVERAVGERGEDPQLRAAMAELLREIDAAKGEKK